ncbi:MAG: ribosomal-processing cysteine protease Prp [Ruminococcus sp.]|nr:ribosomal-processing cysteine protease Prp [Ruminococcus sp.]
MIDAQFYRSGQTQKLLGFGISGHAGYADEGFDIVCASVSSAVMLTANDITEVFGLDAKVRDENNEILLKLGEDKDGTGDKLLLGLLTHMYLLSQQFPDSVKVKVIDR